MAVPIPGSMDALADDAMNNIPNLGRLIGFSISGFHQGISGFLSMESLDFIRIQPFTGLLMVSLDSPRD